MVHISHYHSPIGNILLASKENQLIGLWIENQKHYLSNLKEECIEQEDTILKKTKRWLDRYFNGENPSINELELNPIGTDFQKKVWEILKEIPYGKTITYKMIAEKIAKEKGIKTMSSQAVGNAAGHNPISIIIPCHRVVGTNGSLTGYAGGIKIKMKLLTHEKADIENLYLPKKKNFH